MGLPLKKLQPVLAFAAAHLDADLSLETLARRARLSPFHLHRSFAAAAGETPRQLVLRLRLARAAVLLLTGKDSVLRIALACGFRSHEVFCRAFHRQFGMAPAAYRRRGFVPRITPAQAKHHAAISVQVGPCLRLYHIHEDGRFSTNPMTYSITKTQLPPQPVLVIRRRVQPSALAASLGELFGRVYLYAQQNGIPLAGRPFTRYVEWGPGVWTIEAGFPVASLPQPGEGEIAAVTLPGGPAATAVHVGPYDQLSAAHAAVQQWVDAEGYAAAGAPWESYLTDPADDPDPSHWKTELFWPLAS